MAFGMDLPASRTGRALSCSMDCSRRSPPRSRIAARSPSLVFAHRGAAAAAKAIAASTSLSVAARMACDVAHGWLDFNRFPGLPCYRGAQGWARPYTKASAIRATVRSSSARAPASERSSPFEFFLSGRTNRAAGRSADAARRQDALPLRPDRRSAPQWEFFRPRADGRRTYWRRSPIAAGRDRRAASHASRPAHRYGRAD